MTTPHATHEAKAKKKHTANANANVKKWLHKCGGRKAPRMEDRIEHFSGCCSALCRPTICLDDDGNRIFLCCKCGNRAHEITPFHWCVQVVIPHNTSVIETCANVDFSASVTIALFERLFPNTNYAGSWEDGEVIDILPPDSIKRAGCLDWCNKLASVLTPAGYSAKVFKMRTETQPARNSRLHPPRYDMTPKWEKAP